MIFWCVTVTLNIIDRREAVIFSSRLKNNKNAMSKYLNPMRCNTTHTHLSTCYLTQNRHIAVIKTLQSAITTLSTLIIQSHNLSCI